MPGTGSGGSIALALSVLITFRLRGDTIDIYGGERKARLCSDLAIELFSKDDGGCQPPEISWYSRPVVPGQVDCIEPTEAPKEDERLDLSRVLKACMAEESPFPSKAARGPGRKIRSIAPLLK